MANRFANSADTQMGKSVSFFLLSVLDWQLTSKFSRRFQRKNRQAEGLSHGPGAQVPEPTVVQIFSYVPGLPKSIPSKVSEKFSAI